MKPNRKEVSLVLETLIHLADTTYDSGRAELDYRLFRQFFISSVIQLALAFVLLHMAWMEATNITWTQVKFIRFSPKATRTDSIVDSGSFSVFFIFFVA